MSQPSSRDLKTWRLLYHLGSPQVESYGDVPMSPENCNHWLTGPPGIYETLNGQKKTTWVKDFSQHQVTCGSFRHFGLSKCITYQNTNGLKSTTSSQWHWVGWPEIHASSQHVWKSPSTIIATSFVNNQFKRNDLKLSKWTPTKTTIGCAQNFCPICKEHDSSNSWAARHQSVLLELTVQDQASWNAPAFLLVEP